MRFFPAPDARAASIHGADFLVIGLMSLAERPVLFRPVHVVHLFQNPLCPLDRSRNHRPSERTVPFVEQVLTISDVVLPVFQHDCHHSFSSLIHSTILPLRLLFVYRLPRYSVIVASIQGRPECIKNLFTGSSDSKMLYSN